MLKIHTYANCDTCRKALKFLKPNAVPFQDHPIRETPPTLAELKGALVASEGNLRRLFNTSGRDYKALELSTKLPKMSESEALALLAGNGNLVKRPFAIIAPGKYLIGFDETAWRKVLL